MNCYLTKCCYVCKISYLLRKFLNDLVNIVTFFEGLRSGVTSNNGLRIINDTTLRSHGIFIKINC